MSKIDKFYEKLEALQEETGFAFIIKDEESFNAHIEENKLFAGWFAPGTVLATATNGTSTITYKVTGGVDAALYAADGTKIRSFLGRFLPFENDDVLVSDDKDIEALADGKHSSGYTLAFISDNKIEVSVDKLDIEPVAPKDPSAARVILNGDIVKELKTAIDTLIKPEDRLTEEKKINDRLGALEDAATELEKLGFENVEVMPDPPSEPEEDNTELPISEDIPEYSETEEGKAAEEKHLEEVDKEEASPLPEPAKKEEKKTTKKTSSKTKTAKPKKSTVKEKTEDTSADEEAIPRFDLLPLDLISTFISEFGGDFEETGFLSMIERYKAEECSLLDAAVMYAKANYTDAAEAVTALAREFEADAETNGEDAWKEKNALRYINEAIQEHLFSGSDEESGKSTTLRRLVCAAWIDTNA